MTKKWRITFLKETTVSADTIEAATKKAIEELYRFWGLAYLLGGEPIQEIKTQ